MPSRGRVVAAVALGVVLLAAVLYIGFATCGTGGVRAPSAGDWTWYTCREGGKLAAHGVELKVIGVTGGCRVLAVLRVVGGGAEQSITVTLDVCSNEPQVFYVDNETAVVTLPARGECQFRIPYTLILVHTSNGLHVETCDAYTGTMPCSQPPDNVCLAPIVSAIVLGVTAIAAILRRLDR